mgnify:FL=1
MKFIKLTSIVDSKPIYINIEMIGHLYEQPAKKEYGREVKGAFTKVGTVTHNNGGFEVAEDIKQILKAIDSAK